MSAYEVKQVDLEKDKVPAVDLLRNNFGTKTDFLHKYTWLYSDNPFGAAELYFLIHKESGKKVGIQGFSRRIFYINGKECSAGLVADFAVDVSHRSLGPGLLLLKYVLKEGLIKNNFVYSFPNKKAEPVIKRAGYTLSIQITRFSKVIKCKVYLKKHFPELLSLMVSPMLDFSITIFDYIKYLKSSLFSDFEFVSDMPSTIDQLWEHSDFKKDILLTKRNKSYIDWRMSENTQNNISFFIVRNKKKSEIEGYIAYSYDRTDGIVDILDFFAMNTQSSLFRLFSMFVFKIRVLEAVSISVEYTGSNEIDNTIKSMGFMPREHRSLYYCINDDKKHEVNEKHWFITSWDEDGV